MKAFMKAVCSILSLMVYFFLFLSFTVRYGSPYDSGKTKLGLFLGKEVQSSYGNFLL